MAPGDEGDVHRFTAMNEAGYGERWAPDWERHFGTFSDTSETVHLVAELADGRSVLELGVGSGRLALGLRKRGLSVHGVDNSQPMVDALRRKPGGDVLPVTVCDLASVRVAGSFGVVVLAYSTLFALGTQDLQTQVFANAQRHLSPGGCFVLEAIAHQGAPPEHGRCWTGSVSPDEVVLYAQEVDVANQHIFRCAIVIRDGEAPRIHPSASRYCRPAEIDAMARSAGMQLRDRWGGWDKRPFDATCTRHVSVYELG